MFGGICDEHDEYMGTTKLVSFSQTPSTVNTSLRHANPTGVVRVSQTHSEGCRKLTTDAQTEDKHALSPHPPPSLPSFFPSQANETATDAVYAFVIG
ncbi:unnamed protein product [Taenia asiatica]|uniref:Uncharacterized protein n=1 Tax=Taenia asiatica TaxID=60517 RepID=A0A0R3VZH1_TAEAS|nr:unnamed protein product [Taenia asiatica]